jgi:glutaryl-CoA dehydrogenase
VDGGYRLSGSKMWITNSPIADVFVVWAKTDDGKIRGFILEKGMKGLSAPKIEGKHALRASVTGEIVMDDVFVPEDAPPAERRGPEGALRLPEQRARYGIAWGVMGAAEACWHAARQYTLDRVQFGRPLAANAAHPAQARRHADGDRARPAGLPARRPAHGRGQMRPELISLIKRNNPAARRWISRARRATCTAATAFPTNTRDAPHAQNLEVVNTYEGTHDIHALILGRTQTDIPAF